MQFKLQSVLTTAIALAALAAAAPASEASTPAPVPAGNCNTGPIQCCNSVQNASSPSVQSLAGLLGIALGSITAQVGLDCSPISVIGVGGSSCSANPVCCEDNSNGGLISLGCLPVSL
ncbi:fungal hydrophobin [Hymenopellis radicata]|nr:fungal hydrophobin [Hymenopellis radicata]